MKRFLLAQAIVIVAFVALCAGALAETGIASWYEYGRLTANGERFHPDGITCARRSHKDMGRYFRVTHLATGKSIVCRQNDYGPAKWTGRVIDLSRGAARKLGIIERGVARVKVEAVH